MVINTHVALTLCQAPSKCGTHSPNPLTATWGRSSVSPFCRRDEQSSAAREQQSWALNWAEGPKGLT